LDERKIELSLAHFLQCHQRARFRLQDEGQILLGGFCLQNTREIVPVADDIASRYGERVMPRKQCVHRFSSPAEERPHHYGPEGDAQAPVGLEKGQKFAENALYFS